MCWVLRALQRFKPQKKPVTSSSYATPLALTHVRVALETGQQPPHVRCTVTTETTGPTGVEMEALTAVQVGLLTIYDMCKAADRGMTMTDVKLLDKQGGKSGHWVAAT